jgi:murein L,D-transpeptidase YcbB/YkuD
VAAAQAEVTAQQEALAEAEAVAAEAAAQFCGDTAEYVAALDRYGDVLVQTAPTVGDVRDAGRDLQRPGEQAAAAAAAATAARDDVLQAQADLAAAEAALAAAQASAAGTTAPDPATPAPAATPVAPADTVARVQQAETELAAALDGVSDTTALAQASEQVNAAVVALELAWLQLFAQAGCLTGDAAELAAAAVRDATASLQQALATAGYFDGEVDGVYGPSTVAAVEELQRAHGLPVTGALDRATNAALQADLAAQGGEAAQADLVGTAAVQQTLRLAGFWDGPVDGQWTPALTDALEEFQAALGVPETGAVDAATVAALEAAIAERQSPTPSPTPQQAPEASPAASG